MWGISILAEFVLWGISFHAVAVFGLGKNLLFKSVLGHCAQEAFFFGSQRLLNASTTPAYKRPIQWNSSFGLNYLVLVTINFDMPNVHAVSIYLSSINF